MFDPNDQETIPPPLRATALGRTTTWSPHPSDGLYDVVKDEEIASTLAGTASAEAACRSLVDLALGRGAPDNVTAVVSRYESP